MSLNNYYNVTIDTESKGDYKANTPGSSYYGLGQFSEVSAAPYLEKLGKTWKDYLNDGNLQYKVLEMETAKNEDMMRSFGKEDITDLDRWTAHNLGYGNWRKIQRGQVNDANLINAIHRQHGNSKNVDEYMAFYGNKYGQPTAPQKQPEIIVSPEGLGKYPAPHSNEQSQRIADLMAGLGKLNTPVKKEVDINVDTGLGKFAGF